MIQSETILVVEDEKAVRVSMADFLEEEGFRVLAAEDAASGLALFDRDPVDLVLTDIMMPGRSGIELLDDIRSRAPDVPCIIVSGRGRLEDAISAIRLGAYDYLMKPLPDLELLGISVRRALERRGLQITCRRLQAEVDGRTSFENLLGKSPAILEAIDLAMKVAPSDVSVLLLGESGTGKEQVARAIHTASPRSEARFVAVNCGAIPEGLFESELFGVVRGAFTGATQDRAGLIEDANGGTLFLDEVGEMPAPMQVKLLRALQEGIIRRVGSNQDVAVDVRVLSATNRDLERDVEEGRFRSDLYYRLNVFPIELPPLRDRAEDVPLLAAHFVEEVAGRLGRPIGGISPDALDVLAAYAFPGNVRELQNELERACVLVDDGARILTEHLSPRTRTPVPGPPTSSDEDPVVWTGLSLRDARARFEARLIESALDQLGGNVTQTASRLGVSRSHLQRRLREIGR